MIVRAFERLNLLVTAPVLRRGIAACCAIAFLVVGFAHNTQHFNAPAAIPTIHSDLGSSDDTPDDKKKARIAIEHCQGCTMIAMALLAPSVLPLATATEVPVRGFAELRPHTWIVETPPPITLI